MKKKSNERLLILDLDLDLEILVFDILDLKELKLLLEEVDDYVNIEPEGTVRNETLWWYGEDTIYYYQINDDGNVVLKDLIAR